MSMTKNPFRQLYVGESLGPEEFVKLFSPILVKYSLALFQSGNLVIKGFTGAGKSMLLKLLDPSIRIAYCKLDVPFPIPQEYSKFVGAGINLQTSGVGHFGNRPIDMDLDTAPFYFGDYLNYYVIFDLLTNILEISKSEKVASEIGVDASQTKLQNFVRELSEADCWFGFLKPTGDLSDLLANLQQRIITYKTYLNFNIKELPQSFKESKTVIGAPISKTADLLKKWEVIDQNVEVFIKIDQYEELAWLGAKNDLGKRYQEMIHTLLGSRDSSVSYRIGTRRFAWMEEKTMFGTTAPLEKKRNYLEFHLDNEMRRKENSRNWIFPDLAEDIFKRRLLASNLPIQDNSKKLLRKIFGGHIGPKEAALKYYPNKNRRKAVDLENHWPKPWKEFLMELAETDPLGARYGEAWARQKGKGEIVNNVPEKAPYPWDKVYWKKERTEQALMQLASRNRQQLHWSGKDDILALSGGNILTLLSILQHIWDVWLRDSRDRGTDMKSIPTFDDVVQSAGIIEASTDWYNELALDERGGKNRKKLITFLGVQFFKTLIEDKAMSNPGNNGFSLDLEHTENKMILANFLKECVDYGDLYDGPHTSKLHDKRKRWKYYLNPILSPYFKVPYSHTKEPIYLTMRKLSEWLDDAEIILDQGRENGQLKKKSRKKIVSGEDSDIQYSIFNN